MSDAAISAAEYATSTAGVNGVSLAYREEGRGESVVFVHGTLSDLRTWRAQVPHVARTHRAITYSRRYAPPNVDIDADADDDPMPVHVDDLVAFLERPEIGRAHLVGNSWGGFVSLLATIQRPDLVRSLTLCEPPVVPLCMTMPPNPLKLLRVIATRPRTGLALFRFVTGTLAPAEKALSRGDDEAAMEIFVKGVCGPAFFDQLTDDMQARARENLGTFRAQTLGAGFPPLDAGSVRSVEVPVLLVAGNDTAPLFLRLTDLLEELLPNAERIDIANASHLSHEDNPTVFNEVIAGFLAGAGRER